MLGWNGLERCLDRVAEGASDGFPPCNIERLPRTDGSGDVLRIVLAVAGFRPDQLEVTVDERALIVRGRQGDVNASTYLYRGIAARQFQRTFLLAEGMDVVEAELADGLLRVDLARPEPERSTRRITIGSRS